MIKIWRRFALSILLGVIVLSGCSITRNRAALKTKDSIIIDDYIRYIDKYLIGDNEFVFNSAKELSSETLFEFIHFINAKDKLTVVKYDDGNYYVTLYGVEWILDNYFRSYNFNPEDILAFDSKQEYFTGQKRNYDFEKEELEAISIRIKEIAGGKLVVTADYYDLFDIEKVNRFYSKTYTLKLEADGYKYISVKKEVNKDLQNSAEQKDNDFYINYYIKPLANAGLTQTSWDKAEELDANSLLYYACIPLLNSNIGLDKYQVKEDKSDYLHIPADTIEKQLHSKFDLPEHFLKLTEAYVAMENCYVGDFRLDSSSGPEIEVQEINRVDDKLILTFKQTDYNNLVISTVELTIDESGDRFKYESCRVSE